jgi:hypothetical protein
LDCMASERSASREWWASSVMGRWPLAGMVIR